MKLTEALEKVWKAINKIENIDFDQTGEEIKDDLLGIHRLFRSEDGVMDEVTNRLQELQEIVDEYENLEKGFGVDLKTLCEASKGICYKDTFGHIHHCDSYSTYDMVIDILAQRIEVQWSPHDDKLLIFPFDQYGKTWALTEEGLEK